MEVLLHCFLVPHLVRLPERTSHHPSPKLRYHMPEVYAGLSLQEWNGVGKAQSQILLCLLDCLNLPVVRAQLLKLQKNSVCGLAVHEAFGIPPLPPASSPLHPIVPHPPPQKKTLSKSELTFRLTTAKTILVLPVHATQSNARSTGVS